MGFLQVITKYNRSFWASNVIELFERWAWYGFYLGFGIFLVNSTDTGALGFSHAQKGAIMGTGSMLLYFLPVITGAIADKVGYKKILLLAYAIYASGFYMISIFDSYSAMFIAFVWTCIGGAFFKPIISAMISKTTTEETASIGFGIFYMMINIGGFIGPFIAGVLLEISWDYVFYMAIMAIGVNVLITLFFFKEPVKKEGNRSPLTASIGQAFVNIFITLKNFKYVLFLIIMILFWTAFNQLYYSFPIFIDQWVDTRVVYDGLHSVWPWLAEKIGNDGAINAVTMTSMDSFFIIMFQLIVSTIAMRFKPLAAMMGGILVLAGGLGLMFSNQSGWLILLGVLIFALGEMASSPKFTEYVGSIAPADKKALYMGTSFLPIAAGHQLAGFLSGDIYERISDKIFLLKKEVAKQGLSIPEISETFTKNDYWNEAASKLGMNEIELTNYLWQNYQPANIWMVYSGVAVSAVILLWLYDKFILHKN